MSDDLVAALGHGQEAARFVRQVGQEPAAVDTRLTRVKGDQRRQVGDGRASHAYFTGRRVLTALTAGGRGPEFEWPRLERPGDARWSPQHPLPAVDGRD